ncbi:MAG: sodium ABC transporter ATP-binding protein [Flavobacteriaceae bacterium]|nr:MAG: sodium ABC transporter ATP-binding protein [Flavobacteriaceae bacterium]
MNNILEISNLSKSYEDFHLDNISFSLPKGYIMGLIGPNGSGKTTIIKIIMNLIMKQSGDVKIFGLDHRANEVEVKKRIGFVYDTPNYYDHLNLNQFKSTIAPFYDQWDDAVFYNMVERFKLPLHKKLKTFSKGMAMKSSITMALSHNADFIVMDEPTSNLDPVVRRELLDFFRELIQDENKSVLFSSHITTDLEQVADYITYINEGKLVFSKTKDEVFETYAIVKGGNELLDADTKNSFVSVRSSAYGFEALTNDVKHTRKLFGDSVIYDKASLEDIMFYTNIETENKL